MAADSELKSPKVSYEREDVSSKGIAMIAVGILVLALAGILLVALPFFPLKNHRTEVSPPHAPEAPAGLRQPPNPRLQASPELDLQGYTAGYDRALSTYSWTDKAKGVATIPIDRAMSIAAQHGIPRSPVNPAIPLSQPRQSTQVTGFQGKVVEPPR